MCKTAEELRKEPIIDLKERQRNYPNVWLSLRCSCPKDRPFPWFTWFGGIATKCNTCGKTEPWRLQQCANCDEYFIKDFSHPAYCIFDPWCWTCLETENPDGLDPHNMAAVLGTRLKKKGPQLSDLYDFIKNPVDPFEVFGF
jgi:hypothetical protein